MVTRRELQKSIFLSMMAMIILAILGYSIWAYSKSIGLLDSEGLPFYAIITFELVIMWLIFLFSLIFFGNIVELQGREPGIITIALSYIPSVLYIYALGETSRFIYIFALLSIFAILYVLFSEE